jgi:cell cycle related kinase
MRGLIQGEFFSFESVRVLGRGAFGEVMLARVMETGEVVAIKKIHIKGEYESKRALMQPSSGLPDNVLREYKSLQVLERHPNIVWLFDIFAKGSSIMLVQEYCFSDLSKLVSASCDRLHEKVVKGIMIQVLRGVKACHSSSIMHRDIKPSNILIRHDGMIKLGDFGLARPVDGGERPTYTHTVATRWYRSPELLYGARVYSPSVDIWAVGMVFAEIIGLVPLVPGENDIDQLSKVIQSFGSIEQHWAGVQDLPDYGKVSFPLCDGLPLDQLIPGASEGALRLISKMLCYDPNLRISADKALQDPYWQTEPLPASSAEISRLVNELMISI